jgi:hypothetical protein
MQFERLRIAFEDDRALSRPVRSEYGSAKGVDMTLFASDPLAA